MKRDLVEVVTQAQMDDAVRVVVFTGTGRAFSAGDDMTGGYGDAARIPTLAPNLPAGTARRSARTTRSVSCRSRSTSPSATSTM